MGSNAIRNDRFNTPNQFNRYTLGENALTPDMKRVQTIDFTNKVYENNKNYGYKGLNYLA